MIITAREAIRTCGIELNGRLNANMPILMSMADVCGLFLIIWSRFIEFFFRDFVSSVLCDVAAETVCIM